MKTLEERIGAAMQVAKLPTLGNHRVDTKSVLEAAFPELFDGTHVLLPREPTEEMRPYVIEAAYKAMLDRLFPLQAHEQSQPES